ncbi:di-trans,poly-cis-decaprenylcistransferase [PVC group bacterium (ex Bugula neritina AB1)]|nr:di-trans,poly-cis-decaprenylcistransferase [PVC group bacterium (ex Bugula neritina AB1)]
MSFEEKYPEHVAIIMDGNRRWARKHGLRPVEGHRAGMKSIRLLFPICEEFGIKVLTLYAFSQENWMRPKVETTFLMTLLIEFLDQQIAHIFEKNIRLLMIGNMEDLPFLVRQKLKKAIQRTSSNAGMKVVLAINYGGRQDILQAVNRIYKNIEKGLIPKSSINNELISRYLYTRDMPNPDFLIRTSGEKRLSNFLLWQSIESEIYLTKTLWPDFGQDDFREAINKYLDRKKQGKIYACIEKKIP